MGPKPTISSTAIKEELSSSVKTEAKKKTGRSVTHKKLEAAKRKVRGRPPGTKKSNPKEAINKNSSRVKSAAVSGKTLMC
jgi:hypothetical protein